MPKRAPQRLCSFPHPAADSASNIARITLSRFIQTLYSESLYTNVLRTCQPATHCRRPTTCLHGIFICTHSGATSGTRREVFARAPAFLVIVVLTLGLGIGANTAIFSLMDQVLLRPLPVQDPGALVLLDGPGAFRGRTLNAMTFSYPMYQDFRDRNEVFAGVLARFPTRNDGRVARSLERANGELVSGNYFDVLGVRPALGRLLTPPTIRRPGAHPVAVLGYGYWHATVRRDPAF